MALTSDQIRAAVASLKKRSVIPMVVKTEEEAEGLNAFEELYFGVRGNWTVGDAYYKMRADPARIAALEKVRGIKWPKEPKEPKKTWKDELIEMRKNGLIEEHAKHGING